MPWGALPFRGKLEGPERDRIYARQAELYPGFKEYEEKAQGKRTIPVVVLERA